MEVGVTCIVSIMVLVLLVTTSVALTEMLRRAVSVALAVSDVDRWTVTVATPVADDEGGTVTLALCGGKLDVTDSVNAFVDVAERVSSNDSVSVKVETLVTRVAALEALGDGITDVVARTVGNVCMRLRVSNVTAEVVAYSERDGVLCTERLSVGEEAREWVTEREAERCRESLGESVGATGERLLLADRTLLVDEVVVGDVPSDSLLLFDATSDSDGGELRDGVAGSEVVRSPEEDGDCSKVSVGIGVGLIVALREA